MQQPSVAIVIINWNGISDTKACLNSLKKVSYQNFKIFLVDNGSRYQEAHFLEKEYNGYIHKLIINEKNLGFTGGNNCAINYALAEDFDYVLLLNNDTEVKTGFLEPLVDFAETDKNIGIVGSTIYTYRNKDVIWSAGGKFRWWTSYGLLMLQGRNNSSLKQKKPYKVDYVSGVCLLIKNEVVESIGLLDETFFSYQEDIDWCLRAKTRGWDCWQVPSSKICHKIYRHFQKITPNQVFFLTRNRLWLARKNLPHFRYYLVVIIWIFYKIPLKILKNIIYKSERSFFQAHKQALKEGLLFKKNYLDKNNNLTKKV